MYKSSYTGSQIDDAVAKANAAAPQSTTYTRTEVDLALSGKANTSDLGAAAAKGFDSTPTAGHTDYAVSSDGVHKALAAKLNTADVDAALSGTSTNPVQNRAVQAPIAGLVDRGAKNLLKITSPSKTINGVTFTVNNDGSITANGTAGTGDVPFIISDSLDTLDDSFVLSVNGTTPASYTTWFMDTYETGWTNRRRFTDYIPTVANTKIVRFIIVEGYTVSNLTIYPMLCATEDYTVSQKFKPYAPTNRELYEMILALQT